MFDTDDLETCGINMTSLFQSVFVSSLEKIGFLS